MAISGIILFTFAIGHLIGNLQIYEPPAPDGTYKIDQYAVFLRPSPALCGSRASHSSSSFSSTSGRLFNLPPEESMPAQSPT